MQKTIPSKNKRVEYIVDKLLHNCRLMPVFPLCAELFSIVGHSFHHCFKIKIIKRENTTVRVEQKTFKNRKTFCESPF